MFSFDRWLSAIDFADIVHVDLDCINMAKVGYDPSVLVNNILWELNTKYHDWHNIFSDGSKSNQGVGLGFYDQNHALKFGYQVKENICVMTVELMAIFQALLYSERENLRKIVVLSDSKSALHHLARCASGLRGASIAYDILKLIIRLKKHGAEVRLQWIPGHVGLHGNEEADLISKLSAIEGDTLNIIPDFWEYIPKFRRKCFKNWEHYFDELTKVKGIWYKAIQGQLPHSPWFEGTKLSRRYIKLALKLRSGHYPSAKFAFLMRKSNSPNCDVCNKLEDVQHLLMDCVRNKRERESFINECHINITNVGLIQTILADPTSDVAKKLCNLVTFID